MMRLRIFSDKKSENPHNKKILNRKYFNNQENGCCEVVEDFNREQKSQELCYFEEQKTENPS